MPTMRASATPVAIHDKEKSCHSQTSVPEGVVDAARKEEIIHRTTAMFVEYFGEQARPYSMVLVEEVADGGLGQGGRDADAGQDGTAENE